MTTFYVVLLGVFGTIAVVTVILGEISDFFGGLVDNISDALGGFFGDGADATGIETEGGDLGTTSPSPFSFRTLSALAAGFGAGGLIGKGLGASDPVSLLPASGFGMIAMATTWVFLRALYAQQGTTSIQPADYLGLICRVSISIPEQGMGQVAVTVKGERRNIPALSEDGSAIPSQTEVYITAMGGGTIIVKRTKQ